MSVTEFQEKVYALLVQIHKGRVTTYAALAHVLHTHPRAIGNALRNNPFAPEVPCHRVVSKAGYITGFDGESIDRRSFRKDSEGRVSGDMRQSKPKGMKARQHGALGVGSKNEGLGGHKLGLKIKLLDNEGVQFDDKGILIDQKKILWDGPWKI